MSGQQDTKGPVERDLEYWAWTIIANVSEGNWSEQLPAWVEAAERWRDAFHASLRTHA